MKWNAAVHGDKFGIQICAGECSSPQCLSNLISREKIRSLVSCPFVMVLNFAILNSRKQTTKEKEPLKAREKWQQ